MDVGELWEWALDAAFSNPVDRLRVDRLLEEVRVELARAEAGRAFEEAGRVIEEADFLGRVMANSTVTELAALADIGSEDSHED